MTSPLTNELAAFAVRLARERLAAEAASSPGLARGERLGDGTYLRWSEGRDAAYGLVRLPIEDGIYPRTRPVLAHLGPGQFEFERKPFFSELDVRGATLFEHPFIPERPLDLGMVFDVAPGFAMAGEADMSALVRELLPELFGGRTFEPRHEPEPAPHYDAPYGTRWDYDESTGTYRP